MPPQIVDPSPQPSLGFPTPVIKSRTRSRERLRHDLPAPLRELVRVPPKNTMPHFLARYTLERVIGRRRRNGAVQYLCHWRGARPEEDSWESAISLLGSDLVDEFNARYIDALDAAHDYEFVPQNRVPLAERIRTPSPAPPP